MKSKFIVFVLTSLLFCVNNAIAEDNFKKNHLTLGGTASVYGLVPDKEFNNMHIGYLVAPEVRLSRTIGSKDEDNRGFIALLWTGAEKFAQAATNNNTESIKASPAKSEEYVLLAGYSKKLSADTESSISSAINRISFGLGYGNVLAKNDTFVQGVMIMVGLELNVLSFNF